MMKKSHGFTLIELMITLAVAAVVLGIAIPSFTQMMRNNSSAAVGAEFSVALNYARSEAVKRAKRVSVCASSDGVTCLDVNNWKNGWLVFVDNAISDSGAIAVGTVLRYWADVSPNTIMTVKGGATGTQDVNYIRFTATGTLARADTKDIKGRFVVARVENCKGEAARLITVGLAGMLSSVKQACP